MAVPAMTCQNSRRLAMPAIRWTQEQSKHHMTPSDGHHVSIDA